MLTEYSIELILKEIDSLFKYYQNEHSTVLFKMKPSLSSGLKIKASLLAMTSLLSNN